MSYNLIVDSEARTVVYLSPTVTGKSHDKALADQCAVEFTSYLAVAPRRRLPRLCTAGGHRAETQKETTGQGTELSRVVAEPPDL